MYRCLPALLLAAAAWAQSPGAPAPLTVGGKAEYHLTNVVAPLPVLGFTALGAADQLLTIPKEWGQGWNAYGKRVASAAGSSAIRQTLAFGLEAALREDPRYFRANSAGFWKRIGHAAESAVVCRTDSGGRRFATARIGSAFGSSFLSNEWYPDRLNTIGLGFAQGGLVVGFDAVSNIALEFWPDIRRKVLHR